MPTKSCDEKKYEKLIAQTLFLGASVASFNVSKGWGGQPSQLTVNLIEDTATTGCLIGNPADQYDNGNVSQQYDWSNTDPTGLILASNTATDKDPDAQGYSPGHWDFCSLAGNGKGMPSGQCYVNTKGKVFNTGTMDISERTVPGKVFYEFIPNYHEPTGVYSKYWYNPDPGFFGKPNRINKDNSYNIVYTTGNTNLNQGYDIIDTPVYFKMGDFSFAGIVQSWNENISQGGKSYTVNILGIETILNNCYLILDKFAGAVYSRINSTQSDTDPKNNHEYAGPRNYAGKDKFKYYDEISHGNLPNVFNVYGFLESLNPGGFGGAGLTSEGISANKIISALAVLTSSVDLDNAQKLDTEFTHNIGNDDVYTDYGPKTAFSPYARIVTKCMQELNTYEPISKDFKRFGVIPPVDTIAGAPYTPKCQFVLDLSDLPRPPNDFRISGPVITITDLLNTVTEQMGYDYHVSLYPISKNQAIYNVIKIHTISRLNQPFSNEIKNTVNELACSGINISSINYGKEKNETHLRHLIIGGSQQRLYQAKSLRLAYSQSSYIFNPVTYEFVDYMQLSGWSLATGKQRQNNPAYHHGKVKIPTALSTTNLDLAALINPSYSGWYEYQQNALTKISSISGDFKKTDPIWNDKSILRSDQIDIRLGNYGV